MYLIPLLLSSCGVKLQFATIHDMRAKKKMQPISTRLDDDVRKALEKIAADEDRSLSYLMNLAARRFVETYPVRKGNKS